MKSLKFLIILIGLLLSASGCVTDKTPTANFNRKAVYWVPPEGMWVDDIVYDSEPGKMKMKRAGRMWIPPGVMIGDAGL